MARQYVITEEEISSLIKSLELQRLRADNVCDPLRNLSAEDKQRLESAAESIWRGFHFVAVRWAQSVGFSGPLGRG